MPMYKYVKSQPKKPIHLPIFISGIFILIGTSMLLWVAWPIVSFSLFSAPLLTSVITPLQNDIQQSTESIAQQLPVTVQAAEQVNSVVDYTNPNIWFPTKPQKNIVTPVNIYTLSVPRLKIKDATVKIAGDDLNESLIHYGGTGLPGEYGNTVIFGHSVLPQFFSPTDYRTIFSTLPTIEKGDEIFIDYDGITYKYIVEDLVVRDPTDLTALEQLYDNSYITVITCVPPGTYWKRLNVRAKLVDY
ncbi:sortase [Patescibacteria group bacterium]